MIHVVPFGTGAGTAMAPQLTAQANQVDKRCAGTKLHQSDVVLPAFQGATQHVAIESQHGGNVIDAQNQMIELLDAKRRFVHAFCPAPGHGPE